MEWHSDGELFRLIGAHLYSAVVGDILDTLGLYHQFLPAELRQALLFLIEGNDPTFVHWIDRRGRNPLRASVRMASNPPRTPTVPSYIPALGMASI